MSQVSGEPVPGEMLVTYMPAARQAKWAIGSYLGVRGPSRDVEAEKVYVKGDYDPEALADLMRNLPGVVNAEPNRYWGLADWVQDPLETQQWAPSLIRAHEAWGVAMGTGIKIAIVDTGVDANHPDLKGRVLPGKNFTTDDPNDTMDRHGHGTHCAGIAVASAGNGEGVVGLAPQAYILPVKVIADGGLGKTDDIVAGIRWAADNGAKVISLSFGSTASSSAINREIERAWNRGIVVVAAAGNNANDEYFYPAAYERAIAVAATTSTDEKASFSNFGTWVDVCAPGSKILSTLPDGRYATMSGTSMAAPHVAGLAALLFSRFGPTTSPADIRNRIESTTVGNPGAASHGRIDLYAALYEGHSQGTEATVTEHSCLDFDATLGTVRGLWLPNLVKSDNRRVTVRPTRLNEAYRSETVAKFNVRAPQVGGTVRVQFEVAATRLAETAFYAWNANASSWDLLGVVEANRPEQQGTLELTNWSPYIQDGNMVLKIISMGDARYDVVFDRLLVQSSDL